MFSYVAVYPLLTHILYKIFHVLADLHDTRNCNKVFKFMIQHFESRVTWKYFTQCHVTDLNSNIILSASEMIKHRWLILWSLPRSDLACFLQDVIQTRDNRRQNKWKYSGGRRVARMGDGRGVHRVLIGKPEERDHWGDPDVDGRIILRWIFGKWEGVVGTGWSWLRIGTGGGGLWVRWGTFGFQKCGEFLD